MLLEPTLQTSQRLQKGRAVPPHTPPSNFRDRNGVATLTHARLKWHSRFVTNFVAEKCHASSAACCTCGGSPPNVRLESARGPDPTRPAAASGGAAASAAASPAAEAARRLPHDRVLSLNVGPQKFDLEEWAQTLGALSFELLKGMLRSRQATKSPPHDSQHCASTYTCDAGMVSCSAVRYSEMWCGAVQWDVTRRAVA